MKSTMTETVLSWDHGGTAAAMAQNAQMTQAFHAQAADTGKARSPSVVRRVNGMTCVDVERLDDHRDNEDVLQRDTA